MIKKRGKFLTFMFALLPGASHMFMGFFKMGISFMGAFFALALFSSWLGIGPLLFVMPVIWFYSFFDALNKMSLTDEEFYSLEDKYLLPFDSMSSKVKNKVGRNGKFYAGIALIALGVYLVWERFVPSISYLMPHDSAIYNVILMLSGLLPQLIIAAIIIYFGIRLIIGRKREEDSQ